MTPSHDFQLFSVCGLWKNPKDKHEPFARNACANVLITDFSVSYNNLCVVIIRQYFNNNINNDLINHDNYIYVINFIMRIILINKINFNVNLYLI